ncbi:MAG: hypothetical protein JST16_04595 [Bdellovibrionales bacterium]|nr:hypothetical protein [Bdellovibrionales bacterium]
MKADTAPFRLEREMLEPLREALPSVLGLAEAGEVRVLREPDLGLIIPDLLVGVCKGRTPPLRARCSVVEAYIVALLEAGQTWRVSELERELYLTSAVAERSLRRLARLQIVNDNRRGGWSLSACAHSRIVEIIAVEAKLRRWRDALVQAVEYQEFADRSFVVLDGNQTRESASLRKLFRSAGIGLLLQYGHAIDVAVKARVCRPRSERRVRAADKLFPVDRRPRVPYGHRNREDASRLSSPESSSLCLSHVSA